MAAISDDLPALGKPTNAASAMPQQSNNDKDISRNTKPSVGDDYGDGGIDWSAVDMSVGAGCTGTEVGKPAAEGAADKTAAADW